MRLDVRQRSLYAAPTAHRNERYRYTNFVGWVEIPASHISLVRWVCQPSLLADPAPVCISTQVAIEYLRWVRKNAPDADKAATLVDLLTPFRCQSTSITLIRSAWTLAEAHTLSWFDALIVQAAIDARCDTLYSEDLQHGRKFGDLEVVNPFMQTLGHR